MRQARHSDNAGDGGLHRHKLALTARRSAKTAGLPVAFLKKIT